MHFFTCSIREKINIDVRIMETQFVNIFTKIWAISEHWSSETVSLHFKLKVRGTVHDSEYEVRPAVKSWKNLIVQSK